MVAPSGCTASLWITGCHLEHVAGPVYTGCTTDRNDELARLHPTVHVEVVAVIAVGWMGIQCPGLDLEIPIRLQVLREQCTPHCRSASSAV